MHESVTFEEMKFQSSFINLEEPRAKKPTIHMQKKLMIVQKGLKFGTNWDSHSVYFKIVEKKYFFRHFPPALDEKLI